MEVLAIVPILGVLIIAHELGHFVTARRAGVVVEEFAIGFPPRLLSVVRGGVRYSVNLIPFGAYVRMLGEDDAGTPGSFASQRPRMRALILVAGPGANFLVAVLAFALAYGTGAPDPSQMRVEIAEVQSDSPAEAAGLRPGDVILSVDGRRVGNPLHLREHIQERLGQPVQMSVERAGFTREVTLTPRRDVPEGQGPLGVRLQARAVPVPHDPLASLAFGVRQTLAVVLLTVIAPALALRGDLPAELVRPIGLPGMAQLASGATAASVESGLLFPVLMLAGVFSTGLGVANLLPLPALDGGRLLFVAIEAVRGRRIPPEREGLIHAAGLMLLLTLMLAVSFYDILQPLPTLEWTTR